MVFDRNLTKEMVEILNSEYKNERGWWRKLADNPDTLIAIRNNYLNVYRHGCSIARIKRREDGELAIGVHYKFLLKMKIAEPYIRCPKGCPEILNPQDTFISSLSEIKHINYWTDTLGGLEKTGVHHVIRSNPNVIDTEIALSGEPDESDIPATPQTAKSSRIDFCAVQEEKGKLFLRFFEAKDYSYTTALRVASDDLQPKVIAQMREYRSKLEAQRTKIEKAYKKSIQLADRLCGRNVLGKNIGFSDSIQSLEVDSVPHLVVFGFDADQRDGSYFKKHMKRLREKLFQEFGVRGLLHLKGSPKDFTAGIKSSESQSPDSVEAAVAPEL
jgi:hypothetical protein